MIVFNNIVNGTQKTNGRFRFRAVFVVDYKNSSQWYIFLTRIAYVQNCYDVHVSRSAANRNVKCVAIQRITNEENRINQYVQKLTYSREREKFCFFFVYETFVEFSVTFRRDVDVSIHTRFDSGRGTRRRVFRSNTGRRIDGK